MIGQWSSLCYDGNKHRKPMNSLVKLMYVKINVLCAVL